MRRLMLGTLVAVTVLGGSTRYAPPAHAQVSAICQWCWWCIDCWLLAEAPGDPTTVDWEIQQTFNPF